MSVQTNEMFIEKTLLDLAAEVIVSPLKRSDTPMCVDSERIKARIRRLNELYISGFIEMTEYENERERLDLISSTENDTSASLPISVDGYMAESISKREKKAFWSRTLKRAELSSDGSLRAFFYQSEGTEPSGTATTITVSANINARSRF